MKRYIRSSRTSTRLRRTNSTVLTSESLPDKWAAWDKLSGADQMAVEHAISYQERGHSWWDAVSHAISDVNWGNAEPEYEGEEFYGEEADRRAVEQYLANYFGATF